LLPPGGPLLVLNDRVHLVAACGADGVHVGEDDLPPEEARRRLGDDLLVGVSTHDPAEVAAAGRRGADHAGLGPCFPSHTKALARRPEGAALVRACLPVASVPVFPIGGITAANVGDLVAAGASRVAVGGSSVPYPAAAARAIAAVLARTAHLSGTIAGMPPVRVPVVRPPLGLAGARGRGRGPVAVAATTRPVLAGSLLGLRATRPPRWWRRALPTRGADA
jgi:thiamine-phosphate diphosphorylase